MKRIILASLSFALVSSIHAESLPGEVGVSYVAVSGVRSYAAGKNLQNNQTKAIAAPYIRVAYPILDYLVVGVGYSYYANLKGDGVAPTPDIFNEGQVSLPVLTPFLSSEKIHDVGIDVRYLWSVRKHISVEVGPTVSLFISRAKIANRSFSDSEVRLGGAAQINYDVNENWTVSGGYRLAKPTDRTLQLFTACISFRS